FLSPLPFHLYTPAPVTSRFFLSLFFFLIRPPPIPTLFPYTTLFRSGSSVSPAMILTRPSPLRTPFSYVVPVGPVLFPPPSGTQRSEEHTSELQSLRHLVCRLLLEKKKQPLASPLSLQLSA